MAVAIALPYNQSLRGHEFYGRGNLSILKGWENTLQYFPQNSKEKSLNSFNDFEA
jgi:hypothetical protein